MKKLVRHILFFFCFASLITCKKYPEDNLWFKNPEKLTPFQGYLTKYTVNSIDSLDLLNNYFGHAFGLPRNIRTSQFLTSVEKKQIDCVLNYSGGLENGMDYEFINKKKYLKIFFYPDTTLFKKNIFIDKEVEWKIIRLARNGPFKIETTLNNGNKYEIQIN